MFGLPPEIVSFLELIGYLGAIVALILGFAEFRRWLSRRKIYEEPQSLQQRENLLTEKEYVRRVESRRWKLYGYPFIILSPIAGLLTYILPDSPHGRFHILPVFLRPKIMQGLLIFAICILVGIGFIIYGKIDSWINDPYK